MVSPAVKTPVTLPVRSMVACAISSDESKLSPVIGSIITAVRSVPCLVGSIVKLNGSLVLLAAPLVAVEVKVCLPLSSGFLGVMLQLPFASAIASPIIVLPSLMTTVAPGTVLPLKVGLVSSVTLPLVMSPVLGPTSSIALKLGFAIGVTTGVGFEPPPEVAAATPPATPATPAPAPTQPNQPRLETPRSATLKPSLTSSSPKT